MRIKEIINIILLLLLLYTSSSRAAAIDFIDNDIYLSDTISGLDWLDVTLTKNKSFNEVSVLLATDPLYSGWRYATVPDVETLLSNYTDSIISDSTTLTDNIMPLVSLLGITGQYTNSSGTIFRSYNSGKYTSGFTATMGNVLSSKSTFGYRASRGTFRPSQTTYYFAIGDVSPSTNVTQDFISPTIGSFLVRNSLTSPSAVPIPAAVWLFSSGLIGLLGIAKRKKV